MGQEIKPTRNRSTTPLQTRPWGAIAIDMAEAQDEPSYGVGGGEKCRRKQPILIERASCVPPISQPHAVNARYRQHGVDINLRFQKSRGCCCAATPHIQNIHFENHEALMIADWIRRGQCEPSIATSNWSSLLCKSEKRVIGLDAIQNAAQQAARSVPRVNDRRLQLHLLGAAISRP